MFVYVVFKNLTSHQTINYITRLCLFCSRIEHLTQISEHLTQMLGTQSTFWSKRQMNTLTQ